MRLFVLVLVLIMACFHPTTTQANTGAEEVQFTVSEERGAAGLLDQSWRWESSSSWEGELAGIKTALEASWEDERHRLKDYETKHGHAFQLALTAAFNAVELEWTWAHEEREYPHASYKSWHADELVMELDAASWDLTLERRDKAFPHKPSKDLSTTQIELALTLDEGATALDLKAKSEIHPHEPYKDKYELTWSLNRGLLQEPAVAMTLEFAALHYPFALEKDTRKLAWELTMESEDGIELTFAREAEAGPTKRAQQTDWTLELTRTPWGYEAEYKSTESIYPTAPEKDKLGKQRRFSLAWEGEALSFTGEVLQEKVRYPNAPSKDYRKRRYQLEVKKEDFEFKLIPEEIIYPLQPSKDHHTWSITWEMGWDLDPKLTLTLGGTLSQTHYPNDPARDKLAVTWSLGVSLEG